MAQSRYYSSTAQPTTLTSGVTPSQTTVVVAATTGFPVNTPYVIALDYNTSLEELCLVTAVAGTSLTVTRAFDGTTGASHGAGAGVRHTWAGVDGNDSRTHESLSSGIHGVTGSVVGTTDTQTLTNKSLTSPTITGTVAGGASYTSPTITGTVAGGASYTSPTITNPSVTGTVSGGASYTGPTLTSPTISGTVAGGATYTTPTLTGPASTDATFTPSLVSTFPVDIKLLASQSAAALRVRDSSNNFLFSVNPDGSISQGAPAKISFTPTWTASTTNPTLGNGTLTGSYGIYGNITFVQVTLTIGSTTTFGSGAYTFGIGAIPPLPAFRQAVYATLFRPSNPNQHFGGTEISNNIVLTLSSGGDVGSGSFTYATGDTFCITAMLFNR